LLMSSQVLLYDGRLYILCSEYRVYFDGKPVNYRSGSPLPTKLDTIEVECPGYRYRFEIGKLSITIPGVQNTTLGDYLDTGLIKT